jgi:branched-chain amino acid aminotransferase
MSHVIHYGSSVFEGIRCYDLPTGPGHLPRHEHMQRLLDSAKVYRIDVEFTREQLVKGMLEPSPTTARGRATCGRLCFADTARPA